MAVPITTAQEALNLVADYYKTTVPEIERVINQYGGDVTSVKDILSILIDDGLTAYDLIYNADGSIRNVVYNNVTDYLNSGASSALNAMHNINSNTTATAVAEKVKLSAPVQAALKAAGAGATFKVGATAAKTGLTTNTVINPISAGIAGVGAGIALGVGIDGLLYSANPDFWDAHGLSTLNPETWKTLVDGNDMFSGLFKTDADAGTSQMYIDESALAYIAKYLNVNGAFGAQTEQSNKYTGNTSWLSYPNSYSYPILYTANPARQYKYGHDKYNIRLSSASSDVHFAFVQYGDGTISQCTFSNKPGQSYKVEIEEYNDLSGETRIRTETYKLGKMTLSPGGQYYGTDGGPFVADPKSEEFACNYNINKLNQSNYVARDFALIYYNSEISTAGGIEGITKQDGATTPNISADDTVDAVLSKLKEQYPGLWDDALTINTPQPDGTFKTYTYVPVGSAVANGRLDTQPTNTTQTQTDTAVNVNTSPENLVDTIIQTTTSKPTKTDVNTGTNTGSGGTPIVPPVTGKASALYTIYNPTLEQINSLGAWLWSSNFIDQLLKLFSSPMDAIIGLHKIYATPATGASQNIKVGYLDSGVPSKIVTEQYTTIDCGTINCYEYFGNVLDYKPYTNLRLYLPFIGIIDLSNSDAMRSNINVVYHVDVLTGACLAEVKIIRDGGGGTLYQYAGNACTTLPISSGSYMGVISSVSSVATRALAGFASGGALGAVASGATGILNAQGTNVVHSGGFSGNAGAMGCKKPYLIIERPQTETADNTANLLGYGSNLFVQLKTCHGLTKVKGVHVDAVPATKDEKKLIEDKLIDGVIIG